jgi:hypothetical protein
LGRRILVLHGAWKGLLLRVSRRFCKVLGRDVWRSEHTYWKILASMPDVFQACFLGFSDEFNMAVHGILNRKC